MTLKRFALIAVIFAALAPSTAAARTDGWNVTTVWTPQAIFSKVGARRWIERGTRSGQVFHFIEERRDEWSVYLLDPSRGLRLQLDLYKRMTFVSYVNQPQRRPLYPITNSTSRSGVNGWTARAVFYPGGYFRMTRFGRWREVNGRGRYYFREVRRDEWSVYLFDRGRSVNIQLDLYRHEIFYSAPGDPRRVIYRITASSAR